VEKKEPAMREMTTYVSLDAHKKEHRVAMMLPGEETLQEWTIRNEPREVARMVKRIQKQAPGPVEVCYEAGPCGFALQRQIQTKGISCKVIAPSLVPIKPGERIKTDRRDARKLVSLFAVNLLTEVHPPTEAQESVRDLCRCREVAQKDLLRARHQLLKCLLRRGMAYTSGTLWTQKHLAWLRGLKFKDPVFRDVYTEYLMQVHDREERVGALDQLLEAVGQQEPYREPVSWLRCFRGIDTVTAVSVVAELYGFERFSTPEALMSFLGLTPSEYSSGQTHHKGGITKAGNQRVRRLLIEASWHQRQVPVNSRVVVQRRKGQPTWVVEIAEKAQRRLHRRYCHLVRQGKNNKVAVTAVAREYVGFLWSVLYRYANQVPVSEAERAPWTPRKIIRPRKIPMARRRNKGLIADGSHPTRTPVPYKQRMTHFTQTLEKESKRLDLQTQ
jgi:transposase